MIFLKHVIGKEVQKKNQKTINIINHKKMTLPSKENKAHNGRDYISSKISYKINELKAENHKW